MFRPIVGSIALLVLLGAAACGDQQGSSPSGLTPPTFGTTPSVINRPPSINSISIDPAFGVAGVTEFSFNAAASDPDGDSLTYTWSVGGRAFAGTHGTVTFPTEGSAIVQLTVSDVRGATVSRTQSIVVASMSGEWAITDGPLAGATLSLEQSETGAVTGNYALPGVGNGRTDTADAGRINSAAQLTLRVKVGGLADIVMTGTLDSIGHSVSGTLDGAGYDAVPFTMTKVVDLQRPCAAGHRFDCFPR